MNKLLVILFIILFCLMLCFSLSKVNTKYSYFLLGKIPSEKILACFYIERNIYGIFPTTSSNFSGIWCQWDQNGNLIQKIQYSNGLKHGLCKVYREDGTLAQEIEYENNKVKCTRDFIHEGKRHPIY